LNFINQSKQLLQRYGWQYKERDGMKLDFISARGERLPLLNNDLFDLVHVDGMTAAATSISSSTIGGADGDIVTNVQANARPLVLDLRVKNGVNVEDTKRAVLQVVKIKQLGTLEWAQNDRTVTISGTVESVDMPRWTNAVTMQISMYCSQPFWEDIDFVVQQISEAIDVHWFTDGATGMLHFPEEGIPLGEYATIRTKQFYNRGDVAAGLEISIVAFDTVTNPIIYDGQGNFFGVGYGDGAKRVRMAAGDNVVITTHKGKKDIKLNGKSILAKLRPQSTWLQLAAGDNLFTINSEDESITNMTFSLVYKQRYV
jgi:hypothetical protein